MGFLKKIAGLLGLVKDGLHESKDEADDQTQARARTPSPMNQTGLPRKDVFVPVQVAVDRPGHQIYPLLALCTSGDGGVQNYLLIFLARRHPYTWGLSWYAKRLRMDEDGDVADEFLDEVPPESLALTVDHHKTVAKFKVKYNTRPVKVKRQVLSDGKLKQCVEHQGSLQWI